MRKREGKREGAKPAKDLRGRSISRIHEVSAADAFCSGACVSLTRLDLQVHWTRTEGEMEGEGKMETGKEEQICWPVEHRTLIAAF